MNTANDTDDFEFDPEEFARVIREVGVEVTKFQEHVMNEYMQFGNACNRIITPEFREMVEKAVESKSIGGFRADKVVVDEAVLFDNPDDRPKADPVRKVSEIGEMQDALRLSNWHLDLTRTEQNFLDKRQNELLSDWNDRWNLISFDHETPIDDEQAVRWALDKIRIRIDEAVKNR